MVARVAGMLLVVPGCVLAMIGARNTSVDALIGWSLVGAGAGVLVAVGAPRLRRGRQAGVSGPDVPMGVAAAAAFIAAYLVIAGLLAAFGGGLTAAVLILLAVAGLRAGHRDRPGSGTRRPLRRTRTTSWPRPRCRRPPCGWPIWRPRICAWLGGAATSSCSSPRRIGAPARRPAPAGQQVNGRGTGT